MDKTRIFRIRPLQEADIPEMQDLFRSTVLHVNLKHYTQEEVEDWASCGESWAHWRELLSNNDYELLIMWIVW